MWDTACLWFGEPSVCCRRRGNKFCGGYLARHRQTAHWPMIENTDLREESLPSAEYTSRIRVWLCKKVCAEELIYVTFLSTTAESDIVCEEGIFTFLRSKLAVRHAHTSNALCFWGKFFKCKTWSWHEATMSWSWWDWREKEETDSSAASGRISRSSSV